MIQFLIIAILAFTSHIPIHTLKYYHIKSYWASISNDGVIYGMTNHRYNINLQGMIILTHILINHNIYGLIALIKLLTVSKRSRAHDTRRGSFQSGPRFASQACRIIISSVIHGLKITLEMNTFHHIGFVDWQWNWQWNEVTFFVGQWVNTIKGTLKW